MKKIAIICGGPSAERGISLNSARSLYDNLDRAKYEVSIIYFNPRLEPYTISEAQIYSNTPLDFDYKLGHFSKSLSSEELAKKLQSVDLVFPVIHGTFGEDGKLQTMLEKMGVSYVGSGPEACHNTADKHLCQQILKKNGFYTVEDWVVKKGDRLPDLKPGKYVVKPLHGGSSLGVSYFETIPELGQKIQHVFEHEDEAIIEPFCEGQEFTIIVLQNAESKPVALLPTEIEFAQDRFFDYRKKYLASVDVRYHTPARYSEKTIEHIRTEAERAFTCLGMKDFARFDGWLLPDGQIWFSDVNAISGMEQNSFIFQQAALFGLSHRQLLDYIMYKKIDQSLTTEKRLEIPVIFGGNTAERQVSVMSGTNVWIKLKSSKKYKPVPLFLSFEQKIYSIPHFLCLHHTVEEIEEKIMLLQEEKFLERLKSLQKPILENLQIEEGSVDEPLFVPQNLTLHQVAQKYAFLFLGLHGGAGENGSLQKKLEILKLPYNGPGSACSQLCMDKFETGKVIEKAEISGVTVARKKIIAVNDKPEVVWQNLQKEGFSTSLILKPRADGCSAGVIRINSLQQLERAMLYFQKGYTCIPEKAIHESHGRIDLPHEKLTEILVEDFISTDKISLKDLEIQWQSVNDFIEVTIGVFGGKGKLEVMYPSQTIASQEVLSLEEKFMGGTGINLTPPPKEFVNPEAIENARKKIKKVAEVLGIEGYSRIDTFMNKKTGDLIIIEANTLPGLTPSTVIYHQALAHTPSMNPLQFLEKIIEIGKKRYQTSAQN